MKENITIRKAGIKDFNDLKELRREFFLHEAVEDLSLNKDWARRGLGAELAKGLRSKNRAYFIAYLGNQPIGYSGVEIEKTPAFIKEKNKAHLFNMYVRKEHRNKQIGSALFNESIRWARKKKIRAACLMVYSFNKKARKLYLRKGFKDYLFYMVRRIS